ncbi:MAG: hypothetical protein R3B72_08230 [Polyangiaceae bacterium]
MKVERRGEAGVLVEDLAQLLVEPRWGPPFALTRHFIDTRSSVQRGEHLAMMDFRNREERWAERVGCGGLGVDVVLRDVDAAHPGLLGRAAELGAREGTKGESVAGFGGDEVFDRFVHPGTFAIDVRRVEGEVKVTRAGSARETHGAEPLAGLDVLTRDYAHLVEVRVEGVEAAGMEDLDVVSVAEARVDVLRVGAVMNERHLARGRARDRDGRVRGLGEIERVLILGERVRVWRRRPIALDTYDDRAGFER